MGKLASVRIPWVQETGIHLAQEAQEIHKTEECGPLYAISHS